jgi:hypothetical protein
MPDAKMALMIPLLSVTVSFAALVVWIVLWNRRRLREVDCRHLERMAAIEKGLELPPEPLRPPAQPPPRSRYLLRGLIWLGVGLAGTFGVQGWLGAHTWGAGWIAVAVGAAYLIFYLVEGRRASGAKGEQTESVRDQTS